MKDIAGGRKLGKMGHCNCDSYAMPSSKCPVKIVTVHRGHVKQRITPPSACQALLAYWNAPLICVRRCSNVAAVLGAYVGSAKLSCIYLLRTICSRTILLARNGQEVCTYRDLKVLEHCTLANMVRAHNDYTASKQLRNQPPKVPDPTSLINSISLPSLNPL